MLFPRPRVVRVTRCVLTSAGELSSVSAVCVWCFSGENGGDGVNGPAVSGLELVQAAQVPAVRGYLLHTAGGEPVRPGEGRREASASRIAED